MTIFLPALMILTGFFTLGSLMSQLMQFYQGRPLLVKSIDFLSYVVLSVAGMALVISGLSVYFSGFHFSMIVILLLWATCMVRLIQLYRESRNAPRICTDCGFKMVKILSENRFLSREQMFEEKLKSVEYDLWVCTCGHRSVYKYPGQQHAHFQACTVCSVSAVYNTQQVVSMDGSIYVYGHCAYCNTAYK